MRNQHAYGLEMSSCSAKVKIGLKYSSTLLTRKPISFQSSPDFY